MHDIQGKVVLITGASSGIGAELARQFKQLGARLVLAARRYDRLKALKNELSTAGDEVIVSECDVTKDGDIEKVVGLARDKYGRIDIVIANAGFAVCEPLNDLRLEDYRRQFEVNVFGVLRTIYATLEELKKTHGCLVLIGSVDGYLAQPKASAYAMSKFAVRALADSLQREFRPYGVAVTFIAPGYVSSEIRCVDKWGVFHEDKSDPAPSWLRMPVEKTARKIVSAILARKPRTIITFHGKSVVFLHRFFPRLIALIVTKFLS